jgi:hypothetical protein
MESSAGTATNETEPEEKEMNIRAAHIIAFITFTSIGILASKDALAVKNLNYGGIGCESLYEYDDVNFLRSGYGRKNTLTRSMWVRCPVIKYKFDADGTKTSYVTVYHTQYGNSRCYLIASNYSGQSSYSISASRTGSGLQVLAIPALRAHHDGFYDLWCYLAPGAKIESYRIAERD